MGSLVYPSDENNYLAYGNSSFQQVIGNTHSEDSSKKTLKLTDSSSPIPNVVEISIPGSIWKPIAPGKDPGCLLDGCKHF